MGPDAALIAAKAEGVSTRIAFIYAFGPGADSATLTRIRTLINAPLPPTTAPATQPEELADDPGAVARQLSDEWDRTVPEVEIEPSTESRQQQIDRAAAKLREARLQNDASAAQTSVEELASIPDRRAADVLIADLRAFPQSYAAQPLVNRSYQTPWQAMAANADGATEAASHVLDEFRHARLDGGQARPALRAMAYCANLPSLELLRSASGEKDRQIRAEACRCLLWRGAHEGLGGFLQVVIEERSELIHLEPPLAAAMLRNIAPGDLPALLMLNDQWPGHVERKDNDQRAMAMVTVRAALAKADPARFEKGYEQAIDELLASPIQGHDPARLPWEDTVPQRMELLGWCANVYYVPYLGRLYRPLLIQGVSDYGLSESIHTLANCARRRCCRCFGRASATSRAFVGETRAPGSRRYVAYAGP